MAVFFGSLDRKSKCNELTRHVGEKVLCCCSERRRCCNTLTAVPGHEGAEDGAAALVQPELLPSHPRTHTHCCPRYYQSFLIPAGEEDSILCDIGNNCRHYM